MSRTLEHNLPTWWPDNPPIYDIHRTYLENYEEGPFFQGEMPKRVFPPKEHWDDFLGFPVATPLGVPAGPLLNANWVLFAAKMGFDIVTYKTIRSRHHPAHPLPNMVYVDTKGSLNPARLGEKLHPNLRPPRDLASLAATNSFGIPSRDPDVVMQDIEKANRGLAPGQVMIVSVLGTFRPNEDFIEDFAIAARIAKEGGAKIIEADFSCPNLISCEGEIYTNPELVFEISKRIKNAIGDTPLIIKVGHLYDIEILRQIMKAAARAGVQAICGINTISMQIVNEDGVPTLGEKRMRAGVCGSPIREAALQFVKLAYEVNEQEQLDLKIMGTGGITVPKHFLDFFEAGADVAMSAVGMMWDPYLAYRYHLGKNDGTNRT